MFRLRKSRPPPEPARGTAYEGSPQGWWSEYGGLLDVTSGVVVLPPGTPLPPCPFPCDQCRIKGLGYGPSDD